MIDFNPNREINLINYVPDVLSDVDEFKAVMTRENVEKVKQWDFVSKTLKAQFILEADIMGIKLFEKMHNIKPLATETLEHRRMRLYELYNSDIPITRKWMAVALDRIMGGIPYKHVIETELFDFALIVAGNESQNFLSAYNWLEKILPYNMTMEFTLNYPDINLHLLMAMPLNDVQNIKVELPTQTTTSITLNIGEELK